MPIGIGRCDASPTPVSSSTICSSSAAWNRRSFSLPGSTHSWRRRNPSSWVAGLEPPRLAGQVLDLRRAAHRAQQLHELGQRRERDPRLAMDRRPARVGDRRGLALHQHGDGQPPGDRLHRPQERPDGLDVVADVRHQGNVRGERAAGPKAASGPRRPGCSRWTSPRRPPAARPASRSTGRSPRPTRPTARAPPRSAGHTDPRPPRCRATPRRAAPAPAARPAPARPSVPDRRGTAR